MFAPRMQSLQNTISLCTCHFSCGFEPENRLLYVGIKGKVERSTEAFRARFGLAHQPGSNILCGYAPGHGTRGNSGRGGAQDDARFPRGGVHVQTSESWPHCAGSGQLKPHGLRLTWPAGRVLRGH